MTPYELRAALAAPFPPDEIGWKPQTVKGNRALAVAYIDARTVEDRLDAVFGVAGWQDEYTPLGDGGVLCRLSCLVGGVWVAKCDVGGESEQPDEGDRKKAAFSDALKRAAVKWGVGRYLYDLPKQWCDFDPTKRQFVQTPQLPARYLPRAATPASGGPQPAALPASGEELGRRLRDYDARLAAQKLCQPGSLLDHVARAGHRAGYGDDIARWAGPAIPFAVEAVKAFEANLRRATGRGPADGAGRAG